MKSQSLIDSLAQPIEYRDRVSRIYKKMLSCSHWKQEFDFDPVDLSWYIVCSNCAWWIDLPLNYMVIYE